MSTERSHGIFTSITVRTVFFRCKCRILTNKLLTTQYGDAIIIFDEICLKKSGKEFGNEQENV